MYKVMIVDDERIIRETIYKLVDWKSLEAEVVGVCKDGIEALDTILDESPDIVLTDIKMPGLDGIELIERSRALSVDAEFVILSGYGEFEYAKRAMRHHVKHYLLKPTNEDEISEVLKECIAVCKEKPKKKILTNNKYNDCVNAIIECVNMQYADSNLSLKWIAENLLYMNADYISKQFVKQTGKKFSTYLSEVRIEAAKKLLLEKGDNSYYEVAEMVGFGNNPQYFRQIFKKYVKATPSAWIKENS